MKFIKAVAVFLVIFGIAAALCTVSFAAETRSGDDMAPSQESIGVEKQASPDITKEGPMNKGSDMATKKEKAPAPELATEEKQEEKAAENYDEAIDDLGEGPTSITRH